MLIESEDLKARIKRGQDITIKLSKKLSILNIFKLAELNGRLDACDLILKEIKQLEDNNVNSRNNTK